MTGNIALHGSGVYWGTRNGINMVPKDAATEASTYVTTPRPVAALAIRNELAHYSRYDSNTSGGSYVTCTLPTCFL